MYGYVHYEWIELGCFRREGFIVVLSVLLCEMMFTHSIHVKEICL